MDQPKNNWARNLRFLRKKKLLSQEALAEILGISRSKLNAQENGLTQNPTVEDFLRFSDFFRLSIDILLKMDLTKLSPKRLQELETGSEEYLKGEKIRILTITTDSNNHENLEYVPIKAKAGYRNGLSDPEYLETLPKFSLPNLPSGRTYRMFSSTGDSMFPIPEGADIITEYILDWTTVHDELPYVFILKEEQDFIFKFASYQTGDRTFVVRSLNDIYPSFTLPVSDVLEIWRFHSYQTKVLPEAPMPWEQLKGIVKDIQRDIRGLKRN